MGHFCKRKNLGWYYTPRPTSPGLTSPETKRIWKLVIQFPELNIDVCFSPFIKSIFARLPSADRTYSGLNPKNEQKPEKYSEETRPRSTRKPSLTVALVSSFLFEYLTRNVKFWQILTSKIQEESYNIYSYNKNESGRGRIERQERQELSFYQAHQQKRCRRLWMWSLGRLRSWQSC